MIVNKTFGSWLGAFEWAKVNNVTHHSITASNDAPLRWTLTYRTEKQDGSNNSNT